MHCFAAENDYDTGETGQRNRNLRCNTKSFARFHSYGVIRVVADGTNKGPCFCADTDRTTVAAQNYTRGITCYDSLCLSQTLRRSDHIRFAVCCRLSTRGPEAGLMEREQHDPNS